MTSKKVVKWVVIVAGTSLPLIAILIILIQENFYPYYTWSSFYFLFPVSITTLVFLLSVKKMKLKHALTEAVMVNILLLIFVNYLIGTIKNYEHYLTYPQLYAPLEHILVITILLTILCVAYHTLERERARRYIILVYLITILFGIGMIPLKETKFGHIGLIFQIVVHSGSVSAYLVFLYIVKRFVGGLSVNEGEFIN